MESQLGNRLPREVIDVIIQHVITGEPHSKWPRHNKEIFYKKRKIAIGNLLFVNREINSVVIHQLKSLDIERCSLMQCFYLEKSFTCDHRRYPGINGGNYRNKGMTGMISDSLKDLEKGFEKWKPYKPSTIPLMKLGILKTFRCNLSYRYVWDAEDQIQIFKKWLELFEDSNITLSFLDILADFHQYTFTSKGIDSAKAFHETLIGTFLNMVSKYWKGGIELNICDFPPEVLKDTLKIRNTLSHVKFHFNPDDLEYLQTRTEEIDVWAQQTDFFLTFFRYWGALKDWLPEHIITFTFVRNGFYWANQELIFQRSLRYVLVSACGNPGFMIDHVNLEIPRLRGNFEKGPEQIILDEKKFKGTWIPSAQRYFSEIDLIQIKKNVDDRSGFNPFWQKLKTFNLNMFQQIHTRKDFCHTYSEDFFHKNLKITTTFSIRSTKDLYGTEPDHDEEDALEG